MLKRLPKAVSDSERVDPVAAVVGAASVRVVSEPRRAAVRSRGPRSRRSLDCSAATWCSPATRTRIKSDDAGLPSALIT
jgi:hypothetical protein